MSWNQSYLENNTLKQLIASKHGLLGGRILLEFRKIMQETEVALEKTLEEQRAARAEYDRVLARMKF
jgi:hypothetical protein